ncbi:unnamed protein product [Aphis gossypii]|uniref:Uncharacterized protein n=1 Tax=Aphis gossypii TaxID=80765 RepID=A0A9P0J0Y6_APHGO|nr:unnamed protein product [Aphis gossypii]
MVVRVPTNLFSPRCSAAVDTAIFPETLHGVADIRSAVNYPNLHHSCRRRLWVPVIHIDAKRPVPESLSSSLFCRRQKPTSRSNGLDKNVLGRNLCPPSHVRLGNTTAENHLDGVPSSTFGYFLSLMAIYHYICQARGRILLYRGRRRKKFWGGFEKIIIF